MISAGIFTLLKTGFYVSECGARIISNRRRRVQPSTDLRLQQNRRNASLTLILNANKKRLPRSPFSSNTMISLINDYNPCI